MGDLLWFGFVGIAASLAWLGASLVLGGALTGIGITQHAPHTLLVLLLVDVGILGLLRLLVR